jgi:hypothetical protein
MKTELLPRVDRVEDLAAIRGPGPVMLAGPEDHVAVGGGARRGPRPRGGVLPPE